MESRGIDPRASRMLSERSTIWASLPIPPPGIEPRISCSVGTRLIHWATGARFDNSKVTNNILLHERRSPPSPKEQKSTRYYRQQSSRRTQKELRRCVLKGMRVCIRQVWSCRQSGSNRRPLDYETNATTNCAIAAARLSSSFSWEPTFPSVNICPRMLHSHTIDLLLFSHQLFCSSSSFILFIQDQKRTCINYVGPIIFLIKFRFVRSGDSGDRTRDLSHPKRESYR